MFAGWIWLTAEPVSALRGPFTAFFAGTAVAGLAGGTVHGFLADGHSAARVVLWHFTLLSLGLAAWAAWIIGARLVLPDPLALRVQLATGLIAIAYAGYVVAVDDRFGVAVLHYLPPSVFLLLAFALVLVRDRAGAPLLAGIAGLVLTFAAALVQHRRIALHEKYFNHNSTYHAVQAIALFLIFLAAGELT